MTHEISIKFLRIVWKFDPRTKSNRHSAYAGSFAVVQNSKARHTILS